MTLREGTRFAAYEILSPLGAGGMGEVYRARDTRLNREVAVKVLPETFASDPQRMARFEREAKLLASLNHPYIATVYGLEESGATQALVMELVEGPTLAAQLAGARLRFGSDGSGAGVVKTAAGDRLSPLPLDEALPIAQQIAEALEYAHERGVIHRDLKPANIKITPEGTVKVLDFGLAKAMGPEEVSGDIANSPTVSAAMTQAGFIIGTAAYMSPEQAKAKPVDRRADIWAFGCVLYEMLAGKKAFDGETVSDVLAAVIRAEPDWNALPKSTPGSIERLIRRCLTKDPKQRLRDIGEARIAIEEASSGSHEPSPSATLAPVPAPFRRRALPWTAVIVLAIVAVVFGVGYFVREPKPKTVVRFSFPAPDGTAFSPTLGSFVSLSPDGKEIAFAADSGPLETPAIWVRPLDALTARRVQDTEGADMAAWSPDGRTIAFVAAGQLEKVALSGGPPQALCAAAVVRGVTWNRHGTILFSSQGRLYRVPDAGGATSLAAAPDKAHPEAAYLFPQFLPGGRQFIFEVTSRARRRSIDLGSLASHRITQLVEADSNALYAPPGELLYMVGSTLMARPFDAKGMNFTGQAVPVAENVNLVPGGFLGSFSVSPAGVLAYQTASRVVEDQMTWFSRDGKELATLGPAGIYECPTISPDGSKIAIDVGPEGHSDIWVYDLKRGTGSRLTFKAAYNLNPVWSSSGDQIFFSSNRTGTRDIYEKAGDGLGATKLVFASKLDKSLDDVSPDGRYAVFDGGGAGQSQKLGVLPLAGSSKPFAFVEGSFNIANAQFSPNGRYLAYVTAETGRDEVYVQTFPQHLGKWQISSSGGVDPVWGHNGRELYYLDPKDNLMEVAVNTTSSAFQAGIPKELFQAHIMPTSYWRSNFVVSPDGRRFLMLAPVGAPKPSSITVVVNWLSLLRNNR